MYRFVSMSGCSSIAITNNAGIPDIHVVRCRAKPPLFEPISSLIATTAQMQINIIAFVT